MSALPTKEVRVDLGFVPRDYQRSAHLLFLTVRFLVLVWHRRAGKTVFAVMELVVAALASKDPMARYGYIAPLLKQAKGISWDYLKAYARKVPGTDINESELRVTFPNGARIQLFGADYPDSFRGLFFHGVVIDEPADMKPDIWGAILVPCLADKHGWALFIGTPKGVNLFSQIFFKAQKAADWATDVRRWNETKALSAEETAQMRLEMTATEWAAEMECDFGASAANVLISLTDVLAAQQRKLKPSTWQFAAKVLGVDVARYGDDRTELVRRQGLMCFEPRVLTQLNGPQVAAQVARVIDEWAPDAVFVDNGGPGASVVDQLNLLGYAHVPIDFAGKPDDEQYENKRAEMWGEMSKWVKGGACLPPGVDVAQDLTGPRYTYRNKRGKMQLESKDDMRARGVRSPDFGDGLALTFAFPVAPASMRRRLHGGKSPVLHEYDPYAEGA